MTKANYLKVRSNACALWIALDHNSSPRALRLLSSTGAISVFGIAFLQGPVRLA